MSVPMQQKIHMIMIRIRGRSFVLGKTIHSFLLDHDLVHADFEPEDDDLNRVFALSREYHASWDCSLGKRWFLDPDSLADPDDRFHIRGHVTGVHPSRRFRRNCPEKRRSSDIGAKSALEPNQFFHP